MVRSPASAKRESDSMANEIEFISGDGVERGVARKIEKLGWKYPFRAESQQYLDLGP